MNTKDTAYSGNPRQLAWDLIHSDSEQAILATLGNVVAGFADLAALEVFLDELYAAADEIGSDAKKEMEIIHTRLSSLAKI